LGEASELVVMVVIGWKMGLGQMGWGILIDWVMEWK